MPQTFFVNRHLVWETLIAAARDLPDLIKTSWPWLVVSVAVFVGVTLASGYVTPAIFIALVVLGTAISYMENKRLIRRMEGAEAIRPRSGQQLLTSVAYFPTALFSAVCAFALALAIFGLRVMPIWPEEGPLGTLALLMDDVFGRMFTYFLVILIVSLPLHLLLAQHLSTYLSRQNLTMKQSWSLGGKHIWQSLVLTVPFFIVLTIAQFYPLFALLPVDMEHLLSNGQSALFGFKTVTVFGVSAALNVFLAAAVSKSQASLYREMTGSFGISNP